MFRKYRLYFSALIAFVGLFSLLITSSVKACEDIPQSLLSLYMNSDLVVLASYESDGEIKKSNEDQYGYSLETERNLLIDKVLKGVEDTKNVAFTHYGYHSNASEEMSDAAIEYDHEYEDYFDVSKIKIGQQYLFFLVLDKESGKYSISDYSSGVKDVTGKLDNYERSLSELKSIAEFKENRSLRLTEWVVKNIEEPEFRTDGVNDLAESFYSGEYTDEIVKISDDEPFLTVDDYGIFTNGIAKQLTESQKARISAALYPTLQEAWFAAKPRYVDYAVSTVLGKINKSRLANYAFNMMKSIDKQDSARKIMVLEFLNDVVADSEFSEIYYKYAEIEYSNNDKELANNAGGRLKQKSLDEARTKLLREIEKRFRFLHQRNFVPVANGEA